VITTRKNYSQVVDFAIFEMIFDPNDEVSQIMKTFLQEKAAETTNLKE
jgi:hypothetical protein